MNVAKLLASARSAGAQRSGFALSKFCRNCIAKVYGSLKIRYKQLLRTSEDEASSDNRGVKFPSLWCNSAVIIYRPFRCDDRGRVQSGQSRQGSFNRERKYETGSTRRHRRGRRLRFVATEPRGHLRQRGLPGGMRWTKRGCGRPQGSGVPRQASGLRQRALSGWVCGTEWGCRRPQALLTRHIISQVRAHASGLPATSVGAAAVLERW